MKKRNKKYRPKGVIVDTMQWIRVGMKPVAYAKKEMVELQIKNHLALKTLRQGKGSKADVDVLIWALNIAEALTYQDIGAEYAGEISAGQDALYTLAQRGAAQGRFVFSGSELKAIDLVMEIHEAQMEICTIAELEKAVKFIKNELRHKRMRIIEACEVAA